MPFAVEMARPCRSTASRSSIPRPCRTPRLLAEQLDAAGIPWNGADHVGLRERMAGRLVLRLLALHDRGFTRDDVVGLFAGGPVRTAEGRIAPAAAWERVSRHAGVVGGLADWRAKLRHFAAEQESVADVFDADPEQPPWRGDHARRQAAQARGLQAEVDEVAAAFAPADAPSTWSELGDRASRWSRRLLGDPSTRTAWPADEVAAADRIDAILERLRHLDAVDPDPDLDRFRLALEAELDADLGRRGHLGEGVHVAPLTSALGLDASMVVVLGLAEGTLPTRQRDADLLSDSRARPPRRRPAHLGRTPGC